MWKRLELFCNGKEVYRSVQQGSSVVAKGAVEQWNCMVWNGLAGIRNGAVQNRTPEWSKGKAWLSNEEKRKGEDKMSAELQWKRSAWFSNARNIFKERRKG